MKKRLMIVFIIAMIITETIILFNQNKEINQKNNNLITQLKDNELIVDNKVSLEKIREEKNKIEDETQLVFKEENFETIYEREKLKSESLSNEISELENNIIDLETKVSSLQTEYNKLFNEYQAAKTFLIKNVPFYKL